MLVGFGGGREGEEKAASMHPQFVFGIPLRNVGKVKKKRKTNA